MRRIGQRAYEKGKTLIWGIGTGRCGTKSLSKILGGLHEPRPWPLQRAAYHARCISTKEDENILRDVLRERLAMDTPAVVDLHQSFCMDVIEEIDPTAEFAFIARNPALCVSSFLTVGGFTEQDKFGEYKAQPRIGFAGETRLERVIFHWVYTNTRIMAHLRRTRRPFRCWLTEDMGETWENQYPAHLKTDFSKEEAALLMEECASTWNELREFIHAHRA